jgi:hypothetical protein
MIIVQRLLMFEQIIMHFPELSLYGCGFSCFSSMLCVRMYLCKREVAKDKEQPVSQALLDLLDDRISPTCIRTFIVAIFY